MNRKLELSFPGSVLAVLLVLALLVGPIAAGGEGAIAVKAAFFLIVEIAVVLVISAAVKAQGSHGRLAFRKALNEMTKWKMPLWFPVGIAGIILSGYASAALKLGGWGCLFLFFFQ